MTAAPTPKVNIKCKPDRMKSLFIDYWVSLCIADRIEKDTWTCLAMKIYPILDDYPGFWKFNSGLQHIQSIKRSFVNRFLHLASIFFQSSPSITKVRPRNTRRRRNKICPSANPNKPNLTSDDTQI